MAEITLNLSAVPEASASSVAEALQTSIDAITQTARRRVNLVNEANKLEMQMNSLEAESTRVHTKLMQQVEDQKLDLEKRASLLAVAQQQLELEQKQLEIQKARLEIENKLIDFALDTANKLVDALYPAVEIERRRILVGTLLPELLRLAQGKGLEISLPKEFNGEDREHVISEDAEPGGIVELEPTKLQAISSPLSAIARAQIEDGNKVFVGKDYIVQAGITWKQLADAQIEASESSLGAPAKPVTFDIMLFASEQIEITERQMRLRSEPLKSTPQMVEFHFRPVSQGHCSLAIDFYHKLHWLRTIRLEFDSVA